MKGYHSHLESQPYFYPLRQSRILLRRKRPPTIHRRGDGLARLRLSLAYLMNYSFTARGALFGG